MSSLNTKIVFLQGRQSNNSNNGHHNTSIIPSIKNFFPLKLGKRRIHNENKSPNIPTTAKRIYSEKEHTSNNKIIEQYLPLLRKYEKDDELIIYTAEEKPGTIPGQNFLSTVLRTKVSGKWGNGKPYEKSFIRKIELENETQRTDYRTRDLFVLEAHMYEKVLPRLGNIGPKCIFSKPGEIILEDLGQRQFKTFQRQDFFDLEHCSAVVQTLASMHAKSLGLKLNKPDTFKELIAPFSENVFRVDDSRSLSCHYEKGIVKALADLQSIQPTNPKIERAIKFLFEYKTKVFATMKELLSPKTESDRYWVITHGDTWKNNIMFHHDGDSKKVVNVKLVDFQIARHSSAALDFTYFLYTSADTNVMEHHINHLISEYERFFLYDLRHSSDVPESDLKAFSPGWLARELERYGLFGFLGALTTINAIFMDEETVAFFEKSKTGAGHVQGTVGSSKMKTERILFLIDHYITHFRKDL